MMGFNSKNTKKNPYSPPAVTKLTPEQAKKLVADHKSCSEEEAADFLKSLRREQRQKEEKQNEQPPRDANADIKRKNHSA